MTKENIRSIAISIYWAVQAFCLFFIKSTGFMITAIILLTICLLKLIIKNRNYDIVFLIIYSLYSIFLSIFIFALYIFFKASILFPLIAITNFIVIIYMLKLYGRR